MVDGDVCHSTVTIVASAACSLLTTCYIGVALMSGSPEFASNAIDQKKEVVSL